MLVQTNILLSVKFYADLEFFLEYLTDSRVLSYILCLIVLNINVVNNCCLLVHICDGSYKVLLTIFVFLYIY